MSAFDGSIIDIITGVPGSGKSFRVVQKMAEYIASGGNVVSDIKLKEDKLEAFCKRRNWAYSSEQYIHLEEEQMPCFWHYAPAGRSAEMPTMVVWDEVDNWLDCDSGKEERDRKTALFLLLKHARKYNYHVVFLLQHIDNIDKRVRRLAQSHWTAKNMYRMQLPGSVLKYPLKQFMYVKYDARLKTNQPTARKWVSYDNEVFNLYDSKQLHIDMNSAGVFSGGGEQIKKKEGHPMWVKLAVGASLALNIYCIQKLSKKSEVAVAQTIEKDSPGRSEDLSNVDQAESMPPEIQPAPAPSGDMISFQDQGRTIHKRLAYQYLPYTSYKDIDGSTVAEMQGNVIRKGSFTPWGQVVSVRPDSILCATADTITGVVNWKVDDKPKPSPPRSIDSLGIPTLGYLN